ncbi:hypothetical protein B0H16DRAFT_1462582 [Mycena metata]|uniref:Uncharacterized protein n=1 Tax=Mycena metata TaxID=1033252 RepID=A0AAD7INM8_9AGAR|nr:hypothetical protein B0H16DRAFT_1462582 [Mycena metata]
MAASLLAMYAGNLTRGRQEPKLEFRAAKNYTQGRRVPENDGKNRPTGPNPSNQTLAVLITVRWGKTRTSWPFTPMAGLQEWKAEEMPKRYMVNGHRCPFVALMVTLLHQEVVELNCEPAILLGICSRKVNGELVRHALHMAAALGYNQGRNMAIIEAVVAVFI